MSTVWIAFTCGFLLGGTVGFVLMCLLFISKRGDSPDRQ